MSGRMKQKILKLLRSIMGKIVKPGEYGAGVIIYGPEENISYGSNLSFGGNVFILASDRVDIGSDTMIGYGTKILTATHDSKNYPIWKERIDRPVKIGNHVWIGSGAMILPGVCIGDYSIIAAGAVVTAHVPEGAVVAGVPARIMRYRNISELITQYDPETKYPGVIKKQGFLPGNVICKEAGSNHRTVTDNGKLY